MAGFEELEVWKACRTFRNEAVRIAKNLPPEEKYRLTDQLIRASRSITANIAEGYGRFHFQENIQYCRQARGSLNESLDHLITANDEQYITNDLLGIMRAQFIQCLKLLNGYIAYLQKRKLEG